MSALGRAAKNLETPRPLKARQTVPQQVYEVQSSEYSEENEEKNQTNSRSPT